VVLSVIVITIILGTATLIIIINVILLHSSKDARKSSFSFRSLFPSLHFFVICCTGKVIDCHHFLALSLESLPVSSLVCPLLYLHLFPGIFHPNSPPILVLLSIYAH
jgi:hypothetical protein